MADIIKTFYNYGKLFENDLLQSFNQIHAKKIDKVLLVELEGYTYTLTNLTKSFKQRLILYITSSAGGNLFPFIFMSEKLFDTVKGSKVSKGGIRKSFENMKKYLNKQERDEVQTIYEAIDFEKLRSSVLDFEGKKVDKKENYYIALMVQGKFFNEKYPDVFSNMIQTAGSDVKLAGECFIDNEATMIGFDAGLNFCSTNEMSSAMGKQVKPRLLPLSDSAGRFVKLGFEKIFNDFKFKLFGLNYILLPTVFEHNMVDTIYVEISEAKKNDYADRALKERENLERELEDIVDELSQKSLTNSVLFTMLFYEKNNKEIIVSHTIEDVAPSRIALARDLIKRYDVNVITSSKYEKKSVKERFPQRLYLRDYIDNRLFLAKLLFGKERISTHALYQALYSKIMFGNRLDHEKREFSKILNGYYKDDVDFEKHQRFLRFMSDQQLNMAEHIELGGEMQFETLDELVTWKFEYVDILQTPNQQEFYIVGMLSRLVIAWQKAKNDANSSLESYLNSIGTVNTLNIDMVYRKIIDGAGKYTVFGEKYDRLLALYSNVKSSQKSAVKKVSKDQANILFIMGYTDFKQLPKDKKDEK
jgi:hypothetical protein